MSKTTNYCLGFLWDEGHQNIALVEKARPIWQKGFWNGLGGAVEKGETTLSAMIREGREEFISGLMPADAKGLEIDWRHAGVVTFAAHRLVPVARVTVFSGRMDFNAFSFRIRRGFKTAAGEVVRWIPWRNLPRLPMLANTRWMMALAQEVKLMEFEVRLK